MTSNIVRHLNELQVEWRNQGFNFTTEQKEKYDILLYARREQVKQYYADGRVSKGRKSEEG
jgi:hypothetical protein